MGEGYHSGFHTVLMDMGTRIDLFGTMNVLLNGKPLPKVRSRKAKWLLALLALRGGKPIARSVAASTLWPDSEATVALTNLRSVINDLRQALGEEASRFLTPNRTTLVFDLERVEVDVLAFDAAILEQDFERAVQLYTAPFLQDCDEEWAASERGLRERQCLVALRSLAEAASPLGAVAYLQKAVEISPWQDALRRELMNAHVQAGDLNAALAAYREYAQALRAERGGTPDLQTTDLYVHLRSGERRSPMPSLVPSGAASNGSVPRSLTNFVGREDELGEVAQDLRIHRLVTLTGMGGVGKTRLAREVAQAASFPDGAWFAALDAVHDEVGVLRAIMSALRLGERDGQRPERLIGHLQEKRLLLVLDNCEHLLAVCARLTDRLLRECPELRILTTSRTPLDILGEKVWPLAGLTIPDPRHLPAPSATLLRVLVGYESVLLFLERAHSSSNLELTRENARDVAELCALLEGLPLALELAASRTQTLSVADIVEKLGEHRLDVLVGNRHTGTPRHQTLRATLDWSHSLLSAAERRLFARLSIFSGGWTLEMAEAVADARSDLLEALVDKSLVTFSPDGRYGFLESVREYAAQRLEASGEAARTAARHLNYFLELAERLGASKAPNEAFEQEIGNFHAALDREGGDGEAVLRLIDSLVRYWVESYLLSEGCRRIEAALARFSEAPLALRAQAHRSLAIMRSREDRGYGALLHAENLQMWREVGDPHGTARSLHSLGLAAFFAGEYDRGSAFLEESIAFAREVPHLPVLAYALNAQSLICLRRGEYARAAELGRESLERIQTQNRPAQVAWFVRTLGSLAHEQGDYDAYRRHNEEALEMFRSDRHENGAAWCLDDLGQAATETGHPALGRDLLEQALEIMRRQGDPMGTGSVLESLGNNAVARGDTAEARRRFSESRDAFEAVGHRIGVARAYDGFGDTSRQAGEVDAKGYYLQAMEVWRETGDRKRIRDGLVRIACGSEDLERTVRLLAVADRMGRELGIPLLPPLNRWHEVALTKVRSHPQFTALWGEGSPMSVDEVLEARSVGA